MVNELLNANKIILKELIFLIVKILLKHALYKYHDPYIQGWDLLTTIHFDNLDKGVFKYLIFFHIYLKFHYQNCQNKHQEIPLFLFVILAY
jgi:hypothetical protein